MALILPLLFALLLFGVIGMSVSALAKTPSEGDSVARWFAFGAFGALTVIVVPVIVAVLVVLGLLIAFLSAIH